MELELGLGLEHLAEDLARDRGAGALEGVEGELELGECLLHLLVLVGTQHASKHLLRVRVGVGIGVGVRVRARARVRVRVRVRARVRIGARVRVRVCPASP